MGAASFSTPSHSNGRNILVPQVWLDITPTSCPFKQAFLENGGKAWELNWIATDTRMSDESNKAQ
jgi:hypothetical protein